MPDRSVVDVLHEVLAAARRPALVVTDLDLALPGGDVTRMAPGAVKPEGQFRTVLLVAADVADLRRQARRAQGVGWAREVGVVVVDPGPRPTAPTLRTHPAWPPLTSVEAGPGHARFEFDRRLAAGPVLAALARAAGGALEGPRADDGHLGVRVLPPGTSYVDPAAKHPPDVVVDPPEAPVVAEATGRRPVVLRAAEAPEPLDEAVYRPTGFRGRWTRPVVDLPATVRLDPGLVAALRDAQGVRPAAGHDPRLAAGLAMCGIPVLDAPDGVPEDQVVALDDPLGREEVSVRLRRAALARHSAAGRRAALAGRAGVRGAGEPSVSVLAVVRRPELLAHALAQVARQRGHEVELVLVTHGFTPDAGRVRDALGGPGGVLAHTVVTATTDTPSGSGVAGPVLDAATRASGDVVLVLDGHDWYGPDVVTDLLLARRYSSATVVTMPAELGHSTSDDVTWRRPTATETYLGADAGAPDPTYLLDRRLLRRRPGGPRGAGAVDPVQAVRRDGGTVYRTHGLGHVRRHDGALPALAAGSLRPGFRPSSLLGAPPAPGGQRPGDGLP
ncbi:glycosyltransferase family A protein [Nocardioides dongxiaopingii]|uniref:glycosyltransferase family A protein n=1 Tax=Nocardioides dongxiaopingii TaxID=2576036 RepID=UPI0010C76DFC|nr:glycosyltransferase family A protein [Nocardioides dongxiaopingii]